MKLINYLVHVVVAAMKREVCATFLRCGGQVQIQLCEI